jgi:hypothetical protein
LTVVPAAKSQPAEHSRSTICDRGEIVLALNTSWQFDCRAALEPRAPSSVS